MEKKEVKKEEVKKEEAKRDIKNELQVLPKDFSDVVYQTIVQKEAENSLSLPAGYNFGNALKSAWLKISDNELYKDVTKQSVADSLLTMAVLGLNPIRNQCYFVKMGNKLTLLPSYFGKITALKRLNGVKNILADVLYKDTKYELPINELGMEDIKILEACPLSERKKENIVGAWCKIIVDENIYGFPVYTAIMSIDDIKAAWGMGNARGNSKAHINFANEMAKKSAINRACKMFIDTLTDDNCFIDQLAMTTSNEYEYEEYKNTHKEKVFEEKIIIPSEVEETKVEEAKPIEVKSTKEEKPKVQEAEVVKTTDVEIEDFETFPEFDI